MTGSGRVAGFAAASFTADWLDLRAPFDALARGAAGPRRLTQRFGVATGRSDGPVRLLDLGGGTGANLRSVAAALARDQVWTVVDNDPDLLARVAPLCADWAQAKGWSAPRDARPTVLIDETRHITVQTRQCDLAADVGTIDLASFDGLTASALLDLVSADWLAALLAAWTSTGRPLLFALSVDGRLCWTPRHRHDATVAELFFRDLERDKGFGPALGKAAAATAASMLNDAGYRVTTARSGWCVDPRHRRMHRALLGFVVDAAHRAAPAAGALIDGWAAARRADSAAGTLGLRVGHVDLLATRP